MLNLSADEEVLTVLEEQMTDQEVLAVLEEENSNQLPGMPRLGAHSLDTSIYSPFTLIGFKNKSIDFNIFFRNPLC